MLRLKLFSSGSKIPIIICSSLSILSSLILIVNLFISSEKTGLSIFISFSSLAWSLCFSSLSFFSHKSTAAKDISLLIISKKIKNTKYMDLPNSDNFIITYFLLDNFVWNWKIYFINQKYS